eukprot:4975204-Pleurochrysis_carterae.AAC.1
MYSAPAAYAVCSRLAVRLTISFACAAVHRRRLQHFDKGGIQRTLNKAARRRLQHSNRLHSVEGDARKLRY